MKYNVLFNLTNLTPTIKVGKDIRQESVSDLHIFRFSSVGRITRKKILGCATSVRFRYPELPIY